MADEYQTSGNWWESSRTSRFESGTSPSSSALNSLGSFGWSSTDMVDNIKARSSMDSVSVSGTSMVFHDTQKQLPGSDSSGGGGGGAASADPNLHMMGLGLSTQAMDWNPALFRGEKAAESSFRSILQDNINSNANFQQESSVQQQQLQWRDQKLFAAAAAADSSSNEFNKQMNRSGGGGGFSLDQSSQFSPQYSSGDSTITSQGMPSSFHMDNPAAAAAAALYGNQSTILQGLFGGADNTTTNNNNNNNNSQQSSSSNSFPYPATTYGIGSSMNELPHHHHHNHPQQQQPSSWSKVPQFLRTSSPPKQQHHQPYNHLHFSNNAPYWNASEAAMKEVRPSFFPSLQPQFPAQTFEEKPKNISEVRDSSAVVVKKSGSEAASKRPRNETASPLPAFKVRKEKMGDRITALQQLVSPFGKTDTASVLSEAIEYIKFLHEQVTVLSTPYMKSGAAIQHQQNSDKSKDPEGPKQDLRSRGLCLVPVSSTFPVTHETTVDFWTPTFGGTYR